MSALKSTPAEDAEILRLRRVEKLSFGRIALLLGWPAGVNVKWRHDALQAREMRRTPVTRFTPTRRACMGCKKSFMSQHNGVRFCNKCRTRIESPSPFEPGRSGDCGRQVIPLRPGHR